MVGLYTKDDRRKKGIHRVEVSIGLTVLVPGKTSPEDALHDADSACYEAKHAGRNRVWVHSDSGHTADA